MVAEQPKKVTGGAFGQFLAAKRSVFSALPECKGKPATAVVKLASVRFKGLSSSKKAKYETQFAQAKVTYEKDLAAFLAGGGERKAVKRKGGDKDDEGAAKKLKKLNKDPKAPKKPVGGGYGCYLNANRQAFMKECTGQGITAVSKLGASRWKALSADAKKPFQDDFVAQQLAYKKAMETYVPPAREEGEEVVLPTKDAKKAPKLKPWNWKSTIDSTLKMNGGSLSWHSLGELAALRYCQAHGTSLGNAFEGKAALGCIVLANIPKEYLSKGDNFVRLP